MFSRRYAILIAVLMFVTLVALAVGWVLVSVVGAIQNSRSAPLYWTLLSVGSVLFAALVTGTAIHLALSMKAINLSRRQSNFIDAVTHELKSPLASLKLALQTLSRRSLDESQRRKFLDRTLEEVERLDQLVNHVLDASRSESPQEPDDRQATNLEMVLRLCIATVCIQYQVPETVFRRERFYGAGNLRGAGVISGIVASDTGMEDPVMARISEGDAVTIFRNLLDNAVKYAGTPPEVTIHCGVEEKWVFVQISDNGAGIPRLQYRRIFLRFVRGGNELEREKPGTGLGLSIVRSLVRRWRGAVRILDPLPGQTGACFEIRIPRTLL